MRLALCFPSSIPSTTIRTPCPLPTPSIHPSNQPPTHPSIRPRSSSGLNIHPAPAPSLIRLSHALSFPFLPFPSLPVLSCPSIPFPSLCLASPYPSAHPTPTPTPAPTHTCRKNHRVVAPIRRAFFPPSLPPPPPLPSPPSPPPPPPSPSQSINQSPNQPSPTNRNHSRSKIHPAQLFDSNLSRSGYKTVVRCLVVVLFRIGHGWKDVQIRCASSDFISELYCGFLRGGSRLGYYIRGRVRSDRAEARWMYQK